MSYTRRPEIKTGAQFFRCLCPTCGKPISEHDLVFILRNSRRHLHIRCTKCEQILSRAINRAVLDDIGLPAANIQTIAPPEKRKYNGFLKKPSENALIKSVKIQKPTTDELRTMPYEQYLRTDHWLALSAKIIERAGCRCQLCNGTDTLQAHHRTYENRGCEKLGDLTCLCKKCHRRHHGRE